MWIGEIEKMEEKERKRKRIETQMGIQLQLQLQLQQRGGILIQLPFLFYFLCGGERGHFNAPPY